MDLEGIETLELSALGGNNSVTVNDLTGVADLTSVVLVLGDGSDTLVGGTGTDTMFFNGSAGNEVFTVSAQGAGFRFTRDVGNIVMNATEVEAIRLNASGGNDSATVNDLTGVADLNTITFFMGDGDDTATASTQANAAIAFLLNGGTGNDTLTGSPNADVISGGEGNDTILGLGGVDVMDGGAGDDTITGGPGNETQQGGDGDDTFIWNPGDGSDTLVGGPGADTMVFNGSAGNEVFATTVQGAGFRFTRDVGSIVMDATEVEAFTLNALAGDDRVTTVPLAGTSQNLVGGAQTTADALTIDAQGGCVASSGSGTVTIAGGLPITFSEFEQVSVVNQCAAAVAGIPTLGPLAMAAMAAFLALAALLVIRIRTSG
jgi:Ca2+-binding RTX toxin-like protein